MFLKSFANTSSVAVLEIVLFASPSLITSFVCCGKQFFVLRDGIPRSKQERHPFAHFVFGRVGDEYLFVDGRIVRQVEIDIATRKFRIRRKGERGVYDPHVLCQPRHPVFLPAGPVPPVQAVCPRVRNPG